MGNTEEETRRRSKQASGTTSAGVDIGPDQIEQIAELIKSTDQSWLEMLGDWLPHIGDALLSVLQGFGDE